MPKRYVAETPLARFLIEVFGEDINLSEVERQSTAAGVKLLASSLSRYLNGEEKVSTETVRRLAAFTGRSEDAIRALLPDAARPKATPDTAARELIRETVHETLAQMGHPRVAPADALLAEGELYAAAFDAAIRALPEEYRTRLPSLFRDELRRRRRAIVAQQ